MSKGSARRPRSKFLTAEEEQMRWDRIFGKKEVLDGIPEDTPERGTHAPDSGVLGEEGSDGSGGDTEPSGDDS